MVDCCKRLNHAACCWESGVLHLHAPPSSAIERDFNRGVTDLFKACTYKPESPFEEDQVNDFKGKFRDRFRKSGHLLNQL